MLMRKGISLVALAAVVFIMVILLTTLTISGVETANNAKKMTFASEISLIQESVNSYITKHNGEFPISNSIQVDISSVNTNSKTQFTIEDNDSDNKVLLYQVDYTLLGLTTLKNGLKKQGENDIYALSKDTKKVYYVKGMAIGNKTYYTLTDDLRSTTNISIGSSVNDGIVFVPSVSEWTNTDVTVQVKVPKSYTNVSVNGNNTPNSSDENYNIYSITDTDNYTVTVLYNNGKTALYNVSNVDKTVPMLIYGEQKIMESENGIEAYFSITKSDNLSGVEIVKYENERILESQINSYFQTNGKTVTKDIINISKGVTDMTLYIKDKAGNWIAHYIQIDSNIITKLNGGL
jgi:hypothetical protein